MRVLVLGAAGHTGDAVVTEALRADHEVTAFVHSAEKYARADVRVVVGDARDHAAVLAAVRGQDAVLDTIGGHNPLVNQHIETDSARVVMAAMEEAGVRRLLVISTIGEGDSEANVHGYYKYLFMNTILRGVMKDKAAMEAELRHSALDWTIIRPAGLTDGEPKGVRIVQPATGEKVRFITRADVARFMVEQIPIAEYLHQAVGIANPEE